MCFEGVLFWFNLTTKVAGGNPWPPALSDNPVNGLVIDITNFAYLRLSNIRNFRKNGLKKFLTKYIVFEKNEKYLQASQFFFNEVKVLRDGSQ